MSRFFKYASALLCSVLFIASQGLHASIVESTTLLSQRALYEDLSAKLAEGKLNAIQQNLAALESYPLFPYFQVQVMSSQVDSLDPRQINAFIKKHSQLPITEALQQRWLNTLAARNDWDGYKEAFGILQPKGKHYQCLMLKAEMKEGYLAHHLDKVRDLWTQGYSQPKSCDSVFADWQRRGGLTQDIAVKRFWNAVENRELSLARYVEKRIQQSDEKHDITLFWKVRDNPKGLLLAKNFSRDNASHKIIVNYAIKRLAGRDLKSAVQRWIDIRDQLAFTPGERVGINRYLGIRLALRFYDNASDLIQELDPHYESPELTEWRIRLAMTAQNWTEVKNLITKLPESDYQSSRWQYWLAVSLQNITGKPQDKLFARISGDRSYYGFLASEQLGKSFRLNYKPADFSQKAVSELVSLPAVNRMHELVRLGEYSYARQEWNLLFSSLTEEKKHALAHLAGEWQWHSQAIVGAAKIGKWDDLKLRFPIKYIDLYDKFASKENIPMNWALSITRQESAFNRFARSGAGALGLMQLMPKTAKETAKKRNVSLVKMKQLYSPETNIALGSAYLARMLDRFDGSRIYATAAYNAGPHRVQTWLKERGHLPLDVWIEVIPYRETRKYVQRVLEYGVVYDMLANRPARLLDDAERQMLALNQVPDKREIISD